MEFNKNLSDKILKKRNNIVKIIKKKQKKNLNVNVVEDLQGQVNQHI